jgi:spore maturation protein CgeB/SAM-dependent methyltransferase
MTNDDRVSEVYDGTRGTPEAQRMCRERIAWILSHITGPRVLDIGCSQGIVSILTGRAGFQVLGIDVERPQIEFAIAALEREPEDVRRRVEFMHADMFSADLGGQTFDTVILGEILEHLSDPREFLDRATQFLASSGKLIITTPFGLQPHPDHRQQFYASNFERCIEGLCQPELFEIVDDYIRLVARHRATEPTSLGTKAALLELEERAFAEKEGRTHRIKARRLARLKLLARETRAQQAQIERLRSQIQDLARILDNKREQNQERYAKQRAKQQPIAAWPRATARRVSTIIRHRQHKQLAKLAASKARKALVDVSRHPKWPLRPYAGGPAAFEPYTAEKAASPGALRIASIFDTFSEHCFRYEAELLPLSRDGWRAELLEFRPTLLLAESAWRGNQGQWSYLMSSYAKRDENPLRDLLLWCREHKLPTVFWNKEDPANFDVFIDVAKDFDFVFTTDADCIPRYRERVGHDRVFALPFAAQPAIHNPMQRPSLQRAVCFAGSWRADKYPERVHDSEILLKPSMAFGLDIFDRFHGTKDAAKFRFPREFARAVQGSLDYDRMLSAYRAYKVFLNVNSVKESPTMFSRRVFELMACGTPVLSSESVGIRAILGGFAKVVDTEADARSELERLLTDDAYHRRVAHLGYREVMTNHTYTTRLASIVREAGLLAPPAERPLVSVLAATNRPDRLDNILENYRRQLHQPLELIVLINSRRYDMNEVRQKLEPIPNARVFQIPESQTLADCLNLGLEHANGSFIAKFDDDDLYGAHYLSDLLLCTRFTDAAVLGKRSYYCHLEASDQTALRFPRNIHKSVNFVHGATLLIKREVFDKLRFTPVRQGTDTVFQKACALYGYPIYSADPYNFIHMRHADKRTHTWQIEDEELLASCTNIQSGLALDEVMI